MLLSAIGMQHPSGVEREYLLDLLWPARDSTSAGHSLNSLVCTLHRQLGDAIGGAAPVILAEGRYHLNSDAGVGLDIACFTELIDRGAREHRAGHQQASISSTREALTLYRGDLTASEDIPSIILRERMRTLYLSALVRLADHAFAERDYLGCLDYTTQLLANDPYREDAHRLVMRCFVRRGERSQALRQYQLCADILRQEFDAIPEPETTQLYDTVRLNPDHV
jgi:DNA-binding SARP family transcriptional activator